MEGGRNDLHICCRLLQLVNTRVVHHFAHSGVTVFVVLVIRNYNLKLGVSLKCYTVTLATCISRQRL